MKRIFYLFLLLTVETLIEASKKEKEFDLHFQQSDYELKFHRMELVSYNKDNVKDISIITRKYNRTTAVTNVTVTFNVDAGYDLVVVVQAYKFMSNEYRYFPVRFAANACKTFAANVAGSNRFLKCGNFTGCPIIKGKTYHICNFNPDQSKLPPFIPSGDFKMEVQFLYLSKEVYTANGYASISRPIPIPP